VGRDPFSSTRGSLHFGNDPISGFTASRRSMEAIREWTCPILPGYCWPRGICTGGCLARCCGGSGRCRSQQADARQTKPLGKKGSGIEWCPRDTSERKFQSVAYRHESTSRAPEWKLMRRRTIWFIWKGLGCIRMKDEGWLSGRSKRKSWIRVLGPDCRMLAQISLTSAPGAVYNPSSYLGPRCCSPKRIEATD